MSEANNMVEIFKNEEFGEIRTLVEGDKVLFCTSDVAKALGYANPRDSINRHCKVDGVVKRDGVSKTTNQHGVTTEQIIRENGYLMVSDGSRNKPYQKYIEQGLFKVREYTYTTPYGNKIGTKTMVTGKGQMYFIEKLRSLLGSKAELVNEAG